jgi:Ca2+-binding EF-hand superfamily protein
MQARTRNLLAVALAAALFSPLAMAQSAQGVANGAAHGQAQLPATPAVPPTPILPPQASARADTAVSAAMQQTAPSPADSEEMLSEQQPQTAVDAQVKGAEHAQAHSAVVTRDVFGKLDADGDGKISATEAGVDADFGFAAMDSDGDGFVTDAEYRASAKGAMDASQGAAHAAGHSAVVTRDVFGTLDADGDGKISATEAGADADFNGGFSAMDGDGDGFVTDAEFRAHAKADVPKQP